MPLNPTQLFSEFNIYTEAILSVSTLTAKEENFAYGNRLDEQEAL